MAKATITLANGTAVVVEGSVEEVNALLAFYSTLGSSPAPGGNRKPAKAARPGGSKPSRKVSTDSNDQGDSADVSEIVNLVKNCDEAEQIEKNVLDRTSQVDRTLLPLYIVHEYLDNRYALSSGEIAKISTQLGVPVSQPNVSRTLSGSASRYIIGDRVRVKGHAVKYKLSRRGLQYMQSVVSGSASAD